MPGSPVPPPPGVGRTALGVARIRAFESQRPDRLFDDPYAQWFVDAAPDALPHGPVGSGDDDAGRLVRWLVFFTIIRTRFYDDYLLEAVAAGCRQVVIVAAGLDARAYRLAWPAGTRLFELDSPEVLAFKQAVLDAHGVPRRTGLAAVAVDLRTDWPVQLEASGFQPTVPTAWLVEGLLIYLTADEAGTLLARLTGLAAPGSRLACELHRPRGAEEDRPSLAGYTELWRGGPREALPDLLRELGWTPTIHDRADVAAGYGRPGPPSGGAGFVVAAKEPA
jgi:methyltransferase (TIGR00027 family)